MITFVIFALAMSLPPSNALNISTTKSRTFTVIVSRNGFNGTANKFNITVQQGDSVKITFIYGDRDLANDNPHEMSFEHYGIQTVKIGKSNPTATVEFVADTSGNFIFYCDIPCEGMANLLGHLIVTPTGSAPTSTTLDLAAASTNANSNTFLISATVKDMSGKPMAGVPVRFYENTTFGELLLSKVATNSQGVATLDYTTSRFGSVEVIAESQGNIAKSVTITLPTFPTQTQMEGQIYLGVKLPTRTSGVFYGISYPPNLSMIAVPRVMNIVIVIIAGFVILGVWSTYGYIWRQLANLPKHGTTLLPGPQAPLPEATIPVDTGAITTKQAPYVSGKTFTLLLLTPLLGAGDVMLVNNLGLPLLWRTIALVGLAVSETAAILTVVSGRRSAE
jgi:hypothetical protein